VPRPLIPEIRAEAIRAINQGRVLPYCLQHHNFHRFYTGPALPPYPPGSVPAGFLPPPPPPPLITTAAPVVPPAVLSNTPAQSALPAPTAPAVPAAAASGPGPVVYYPVPGFVPWVPPAGPISGLGDQQQSVLGDDQPSQEEQGDNGWREETPPPESLLPPYPSPPARLSL